MRALGGRVPFASRTAPISVNPVLPGALAIRATMVLSGTWAQNDSGGEIDFTYSGDAPAYAWSIRSMDDPYAYGQGFTGADNVQFRLVALGSGYQDGSNTFTTSSFDPGDVSDQFSIDYLATMMSDPVEQRQFLCAVLIKPGGVSASISHPNIGAFDTTLEIPAYPFTEVTLVVGSCDVGDMSSGSAPITIASSRDVLAWLVYRVDNASGPGFKAEDNNDGSPGQTMTGVSSSSTGDYIGFVGSCAAPAPSPSFASPYDAHVSEVRA